MVRNPHRVEAIATLVAHTSTAIEITQLLDQLRHTAGHDPLAGLPNRRNLDHELGTKANQPGLLAVAFVDLDDFKTINDRYGYDTGDKALIAIGRRFQTATGPYDVVARYGGDEFVILLPNADLTHARHIANTVLQALNHPVALGPLQLSLSLSIGVAATKTPAPIAELMAAADQAVYHAKQAGKASFSAVNLTRPTPDPPTPDTRHRPTCPRGGSAHTNRCGTYRLVARTCPHRQPLGDAHSKLSLGPAGPLLPADTRRGETWASPIGV